jgi:hypothetical protein
MHVNPIEIPTHTSHDGKYDPRMLKVGGSEQPEIAITNRLAPKLVHKR